MTIPTLSAAATAWFWETFGKDLAKTLAKDVWNTLNWAAAAQRYRQHLYKQYSHIHIFGMAEPVPLKGVFTHIVTLDKPADRHRYDIAALQEEATRDPERIHELMTQHIYGETKRVDGCALVRQSRSNRLFILGKPGAGKTTFLKYLALQAAQGDLNQIPIFVTLREWRAEGDLLAFLAHQFEICNFPEAAPFIQFVLAHTNYGLVLFDGLDEIPQEGERRDHAIAAIRDFARQYPRAQVLITCRNAASDVTFEGFKYVEIADFQDGQMYAFVRKWFKAVDVLDVAERFWEDLNKSDNRGIREMGRQPLLLTLLCLTYQETLHFPQRRVEIYEEALEALLKKWDSSRQITRDSVYKDLSLGRKRQLLARIAAEFFDRSVYFIPQHELVQIITRYVEGLPVADRQRADFVDGMVILREIEAQHGILVQCAHQVYAFAHLTFQEYYTACYVVQSAASGESGTIRRLLTHVTEDRWREVILLTASMLDKADNFFGHFLKALEFMVYDDTVLIDFLAWVQRKANTANVSHKSAAVRACYAWFVLVRDLSIFFTNARDHVPHLDTALYSYGLYFFRKYEVLLERELLFTLACNLDHNCTLDQGLAYALIYVRELEHALVDFLGLDRTNARDHAQKLDHDNACARARERTHHFASALADILDGVSAPAFSGPLNFDLLLILALALTRDIAHISARNLARIRARNIAQIRARALTRVLDLINTHDSVREAEANVLHSVLATLIVPNWNAPQAAWYTFAKQLQTIMTEHRDIGLDWKFTAEQINRLERYFLATHFLLQCLDLAYVTDRAAIEDRLLLPPKVEEAR